MVSAACFFLVVETHHPALLRKEVIRLKKETGNQDLYCGLDDRTMTAKIRLQRAIIRPMKMLITVPPITILSLYVAIVYGILYVFFSTFSFVFKEQYHFSTGTIGLTYVPAGIGMMIGLFTLGPVTDLIITRRIKQGGQPVPEDRLPVYLTVPGGLMIPIALFWYGWAIEKNTHWIVPMIAEVVFCIGLMVVMVSLQFSFNPLIPYILFFAITDIVSDVRADIPRRRKHQVCRLRGRSNHRAAFPRRRVPPPRRLEAFRQAGSRLGKQRACFCLIGLCASAGCVPVLRAGDTRKVSSEA